MIGAYRSIDAIIEDRLARFHARRAQEQAPSDAVARVYAARRGRIAGGIAGVVCGGLMFLSAFLSLGPRVLDLPSDSRGAVPTYLLAGGGIAALVVASMARRAARRRAAASLRQEPALTGDGPEDIGRIERADPLGDLRARAAALETKSVALPLVAIALLAPLTMHGIVVLGISMVNGRWVGNASDFGVWIGVSGIVVGVAHVTLAVRVALWARSLRDRETRSFDKIVHGEWTLTLFITAISAFVPGVFIASHEEALSVIPPVLVLVTGIAFLPFAYVATVRQLKRERPILSPDRPSVGIPDGSPVDDAQQRGTVSATVP